MGVRIINHLFAIDEELVPIIGIHPKGAHTRFGNRDGAGDMNTKVIAQTATA